MSSEDELIGTNSPKFGDLFGSKAQDGPMGHLGGPPDQKKSGVTTPQLSSVVRVPGKAKAESDQCPKTRH